MRGRLDEREIEDIGDTARSYSEGKALASGDPRILEKARVDAELTRLERLERAHARNQRTLAAAIDKAEQDLPRLQTAREQVEDAITGRVDTGGDRFAMTVNGARWASRAAAAIALRNALSALRPDGERGYDKPTHLATLAGFDIIATARRYASPSSPNAGRRNTPRSSGCGPTPGQSSCRSWPSMPRSAPSYPRPTPSKA
jgi:hypothetical protein